MPAGRNFRQLLSALLPVLVWAIPLGANFFFTPKLIQAMGENGYGAYSLAWAMISFAVIPSGASTLARFTADPAAGPPALASLMLRIHLLQWAAIAFNAAFVWIIYMGSGYSFQMELTASRWIIVLIAVVLLASTLLMQLLSAALQRLGLWELAAAFLILTGIALPFSAMQAVQGEADWANGLIAQMAVSLSGCGLLLLLFLKQPSPGGRTPVAYAAIGGYMARLVMASAFGPMLALGERFVVVHRFGAASAGHFAIAFTLAAMVHAIVFHANMRLPLAFSGSGAHREDAHREQIYRRSARLSAIMAGFAAVMIVVNGKPFLTLWLGADVGADVYSLVTPLAAGVAGFALAVPAWIAAEVFGHERVNIGFGAAYFALWLLIVSLVPLAMGPFGVALGRISVLLCVLPYIAVVERQVFGRFSPAFWLHIIAASAAGMVVSAWIMTLSGAGNWGSLILSSFLGAISFGLISWASRLFRLEDLTSPSDQKGLP